MGITVYLVFSFLQDKVNKNRKIFDSFHIK